MAPPKARPGKTRLTLKAKAHRAKSSILDRELVTFTPKQRAYIDAVTTGSGVVDAARLAGYRCADRVGYNLLSNPAVRDELNRRMVKARERLEMTRERVQDMVLEAYEVAKLQADAASMVRAASEINRMCGFYASIERRVQLDVTATVRHEELRTLSDVELIQMAGRQVGREIEGEARLLVDETVRELLAEELSDDLEGEADDDA